MEVILCCRYSMYAILGLTAGRSLLEHTVESVLWFWQKQYSAHKRPHIVLTPADLQRLLVPHLINISTSGTKPHSVVGF